MKKFWIFCTLVLLTASAVGQHPFMGTHTETRATNLALVWHVSDCSNNNCWHQSSAAAQVSQAVFASNRTAFHIDQNFTAHQYTDYPTNSWTAHPEWGQVFAVAEDAYSNVWVLYNNGNCPPGGGYSLGKIVNGSIQLETYCFMQFGFSADHTNAIMLVDVNGTPWEWFGTAWQHAPYPGCPVHSIAPYSTAQWFLTCTDTSIWEYSNGGYSRLPGSAQSSGTNVNIAIDPAAELYVIGTDSRVYHYNTNVQGSWEGLNLTGFTSLAIADGQNVWGVAATVSGNNLYRFTEETLQNTHSLTETATCVGCTHTNSVHAGFTGPATSDGGYQIRWNPNGGTRTIQSISRMLDILGCFEAGQPGCAPHNTDSVDCTVAGELDNADISGPLVSVLTATSHVVSTSAPTCTVDVTAATPDFCVYPVVPDCDNTTNPALNPATVSYSLLGYNYFDIHGSCFSWNGGPYSCINNLPIFQPVPADKAYKTDIGPVQCTAQLP